MRRRRSRDLPAQGGRTNEHPVPAFRVLASVLPGGVSGAGAGRGAAGAAQRDGGDRARGGDGRPRRPEDRGAGRAGRLRRVRRGQPLLLPGPPVRPVRAAAAVLRPAGTAQPGLGGPGAAAVRRPDHRGLPVHSRRAYRGDVHLRRAAVSVAQVRGRHGVCRGHLGQLRVLPRAAGREGVRGPAVAGLPARLRGGRGGQRRGGDPAPDPPVAGAARTGAGTAVGERSARTGWPRTRT